MIIQVYNKLSRKAERFFEFMEDKNPIQVAGRIFHTIETLAANGPCGLLELSALLELNKSTVHRILNSLIYMGYVIQDSSTSKYSLSFRICELSNQILMKNDMVDIVRPFLKDLVAKTEETVHLVQLDGTKAVYIDKVESYSNSVRMVSKVGKSIPLYCSGVGKAILAELPDEKIAAVWNKSDIRSITPHTITSYEMFMEKIAQIRNQGYATDDEENELGVRCIAVSLPDYVGKVKYAVSISAPISRMSDERIRELAMILMETKRQIVI